MLLPEPPTDLEVGSAPREISDEVKAVVGLPGPRRAAYYAVDATSIGYFCEFSENADHRYDRRRAARVRAPATYLLTAMRSPIWAPDRRFLPHQYVTVSLALGTTKSVNLSVEHEFITPLYEEDQVTFVNTITQIVPSTNRLGAGFRVSEKVESFNQRDEPIAVTVVTTFAYGYAEPADSAEAR
jgi:hypothetical protein